LVLLDSHDSCIDTCCIHDAFVLVTSNASYVSLQVVKGLNQSAVSCVPSRELTLRVSSEKNIIVFAKKLKRPDKAFVFILETSGLPLGLLHKVQITVESLHVPFANGRVCIATVDKLLIG